MTVGEMRSQKFYLVIELEFVKQIRSWPPGSLICMSCFLFTKDLSRLSDDHEISPRKLE